MPLLTLLPIALGLALDAFAVAAAAASAGFAGNWRARFRLWFHFGLFQALMPVAGWFLGAQVAPLIAAWDHWVAFLLLAGIGLHMIRGGVRTGASTAASRDPTRGRSLIMLSLATSIDALAVGFGFACLGVSIWRPAATIGLVTAAVSYLGCIVGDRLGRSVGPRAAIVGGIVLVLVGLRIVLSHLRGG